MPKWAPAPAALPAVAGPRGRAPPPRIRRPATGLRGPPCGTAAGSNQLDVLEQQFQAQLHAFFNLFADIAVPSLRVEQEFLGLLALRSSVADLRLPGNAAEQQRGSLLQAVNHALSAAGGQMSMTDLCCEHQVQALRKGVVAQMGKFLSKYPQDYFIIDEPQEDPSKAPVKMVKLLRPATFASPLPLRRAPQRDQGSRAEIPRLVAHVLREAGGEALLDTICKEPRVAEARKGAVASMWKFLGKHEAFELFQGPPSEEGKCSRQMVRLCVGAATEELLARPPDAAAAAYPSNGALAAAAKAGGLKEEPGDEEATAEGAPPAAKRQRLAAAWQGAGAQLRGMDPQEADARRAQLLQEVRTHIEQAANFIVTMDELGRDPKIQELKQGVVAKLGPFLEKQQGLFSVFEAQAENGHTHKYVGFA